MKLGKCNRHQAHQEGIGNVMDDCTSGRLKLQKKTSQYRTRNELVEG